MGRITLSSLCERRLPRRRGVITLELILWLPIMVIFVLAIVEFALIMQFNKQVAYASRFGAKLASEIARTQAASPNLSNFNLSATANNLKDQVDAYLANHGISSSCEVRLTHNACVGGTSQVDTDAACNCGDSAPTLPGGEPPAGEAYVKVTVCVKLTGNVPNCLSTFGFDLNGPNGTAGDADDCTIEHSTVFRVETNNATAQPDITANSVAGLDGDDVENTPVTNGNVTITINGGNPNPGDTLTIDLTGAATDPEDGVLTGGSLVWTVVSVPAAPAAALDDGIGVAETLDVIVPATGGGSQVHTLTLTSTDSCNATAARTITITVTNNSP